MNALEGRVDAEAVDAVVVTLLANAERVEAAHIMRAAVRAGLMWRCRCRQPNYLGHRACSACADPPPHKPVPERGGDQ